MVLVQIANDLLVQTVNVSGGSFYVGFECSQPVSLQAASTVRVGGVLQRVTGSGFKLFGVIDGSNDLWTWVPVHASADLITTPPAKFTFAPSGSTAFPSGYARVRWVLEPDTGALAAGWSVVLSAHTNTGLR
jgi:hypothetical protein